MFLGAQDYSCSLSIIVSFNQFIIKVNFLLNSKMYLIYKK